MQFGFIEIQGLATVILFGIVVWLVTEQKILRKQIQQQTPKPVDNSALQLQAYERLTLLTERISLKNLIMRLPTASLTALELQVGMIETIRSESEHNITQQLYVNPEIWKAIINLKEQNIYIINQLAAALPPTAAAIDLSKAIIQYQENNNAELSKIVLDALQFEAKKLI
ncbi:MAG: hypothetical protein IPJ81_17815 [Chitinophagaceae bacterium]|nr:hypothetical protein [Chitinophagaceae bacterium]